MNLSMRPHHVSSYLYVIDNFPMLHILVSMAKRLSRADIVALIRQLVERSGTWVGANKAVGIGPVHIGEVLNGTRDPVRPS